MADFRLLLSPGVIGGLTIPNRVIMGAINNRYELADGSMSPAHITYLVERAKGGTGLVTTHGVSPTKDGCSRPTQLSVEDDRFLAGLAQVAEAVHTAGSKLSVQLMHAGGRVTEAGWTDARPVSSSALPNFISGVVARTATKDDIQRLVQGYGNAARRCKEAGCDAVELHGAHGYLVSQFLSPYTNKRTDEYGGSVENRCRFAVEIVQSIKRHCGGHFPLIVKFNGDDRLPGGVTPENALRQARILAAAGSDALIVSAGLRETMDWQIQTYEKETPTLAHLSAAVKAVVDVPVVAVGKIKTPAMAERILEAGQADFVCIARGLIADAYWMAKAAEGRASEIRVCIADNCGCIDRDPSKYVQMTCTINPAVGREEAVRARPAATKKRVAVIGGGLAGMRAAATAAERGHEVALFEEGDRLGGTWSHVADHRPELRAAINFLRREMERQGVAVHLNAKQPSLEIQRMSPEAVVVVPTAQLNVPDLPGHHSHVVDARSVMAGAETGRRVVLLGGDFFAIETALELARRDKEVSLVAADKLGGTVGKSLRIALLGETARQGIQMFDYSRPIGLAEDGVEIVHDQEAVFLPADTVVIATGFRQAQPAENFSVPTFVLPDAYDPPTALEAIRQGLSVGLEI